MSLTYSVFPNLPFDLKKVLVLDEKHLTILLQSIDEDCRACVAALGIHPDLFKNVLPFDLQTGSVTEDPDAQWFITDYGFVITRIDMETMTRFGRADYQNLQDIMALTFNNRRMAITLLQHLILTRQTLVPDFMTIMTNKINVNRLHVEMILGTTEVICERLPNHKGYRFMAVLSDGYILAEHSSFSALPVNNDAAVATKMGVAAVRSLASDKLWELLSWQMRNWMQEQIIIPLPDHFKPTRPVVLDKGLSIPVHTLNPM